MNLCLLCLDEMRRIYFTCVSCLSTKGDACCVRVSPLSRLNAVVPSCAFWFLSLPIFFNQRDSHAFLLRLIFPTTLWPQLFPQVLNFHCLYERATSIYISSHACVLSQISGSNICPSENCWWTVFCCYAFRYLNVHILHGRFTGHHENIAQNCGRYFITNDMSWTPSCS
jgi:hypothetical protein